MTGGLFDAAKERLGTTKAPHWLDPIIDPATRSDGVELDRWVIDFGWETNPIPMNGPRGNPRAHARRVRNVRSVARNYADIAGIPPLGRCTVALTWYVLTTHRRDAVNLSNLLKAIQDGLVDAHVVDDDTPDLMNTIMPAIVRVDPMKHQSAWMELVVTRWEGPTS